MSKITDNEIVRVWESLPSFIPFFIKKFKYDKNLNCFKEVKDTDNFIYIKLPSNEFINLVTLQTEVVNFNNMEQIQFHPVTPQKLSFRLNEKSVKSKILKLNKNIPKTNPNGIYITIYFSEFECYVNGICVDKKDVYEYDNTFKTWGLIKWDVDDDIIYFLKV